MERVYTLCLSLFLFVICAHSFPGRLLYDYQNIGTNLPNADDVSSSEVKLNVPIVFYGQTYSSLYVNSNGLISFQTDIPTFFNIEFPLDYPVIAPLYSNVDISKAGTVSYYETNNPALLQRATNNVHDSFSYTEDFQATGLFVVTWSQVGYHKNGANKLNTFQVAIVSDGDDSFVEFLYPEDGIQWLQGTGDESGLPDARAQAGFVASDGRYYLLQGSGTDQVKNLERWSNINLPGQWIFRVGQLDQDANIEEPDIFNDVSDNSIPKSCDKGASQCNAFAKCTDYNEGFCCVCKQQYYGNGKFCIKKDVPLRVNGKLNGKINGEALVNLDLQSYIVMSDGRAYTAISKIPESIGYDVQSLQILGGVLGWTFAKPVKDAVNGFHLTGGVFNHTATLVFPNTNHKVIFKHKYVGLDVFDQLRLEANVQGSIPHIPIESKINVEEYEEQYTLTAPGTLQSSSTRMYTYTNLDGVDVKVAMSIDQSIIFDYCKFESEPVGTTWRLKVGKNFISFEATEQIVRFGLSNKIAPLGDTDPCNEGRVACGPNSACVVENDSYRCLCNPGYQYIYKDNVAVCEDINECQTGLQDCDFNAECVNSIGSYSCKCNAGFEGNGKFCENSQTCRNVQCPENAECIEYGVAVCRCLPGFTGNGQVCTPLVNRSCHIANNCSPYGMCTINQETNLYSCICLPGYVGDGYQCEEVVELITTTEVYVEEPLIAQCLFSVCWCPGGYELQEGTTYCHVIKETTTLDYNTTPEIKTETETEAETETETEPSVACNVINNCHRNALCIYEISISNYQCICNIGFEGDGYDCAKSELSCTHSDVCHIHASCLYSDSVGKSVCVCDPGYVGNGEECRSGGCNSNDDCPPNEHCFYAGPNQGYECVCNDGLVRDSQQQCVILAGSCGGVPCADNAECLYDDVYQTFYCKCKSDFDGDGITECKLKTVDCNIVNNCSPQASCVYDQQQNNYQCVCNQGFQGDGFACKIEKNCNNDPYICDRHAVCLTTTDSKYVCECQQGYVGNGTFCKESARHEGNFLLLNQGKGTFRISFDASKKNPAKLIYISEFQTTVGLDVDCLLGRVYWSDISGRAIKSAAYNGSDVVNFLTTDVGSPEGLSVDWVSRNIYWTDSTKDTIEVANIETKLRTTLFDTNLVNPRGIAVHPQRGKIFWTDWDRRNPKIEWANADGTEREIFLQGDSVQLPNSLVIDFETERLCYADAGTKSIECLDIDSRYRETIATNCTYPFGITVTDEHIYWSDWIVKKIERVDKQTLKRLKPLDAPLGDTNKLYGLVAVPQHCLGITNVCQYYKNQCPKNHICLPDGKGNRRCLCGHSMDSSADKGSCNL